MWFVIVTHTGICMTKQSVIDDLIMSTKYHGKQRRERSCARLLTNTEWLLYPGLKVEERE